MLNLCFVFLFGTGRYFRGCPSVLIFSPYTNTVYQEFQLLSILDFFFVCFLLREKRANFLTSWLLVWEIYIMLVCI